MIYVLVLSEAIVDYINEAESMIADLAGVSDPAELRDADEERAALETELAEYLFYLARQATPIEVEE
jgi:hypothetical protein